MNQTCVHDILIVDDSPAMRKFVRRVLDISGFPIGVVSEAADGLDALNFLSERSVDLILTDVNMPRMGGEEFMEKMACEPKMRGVPVVVISTDSTRQRAGRMMARGARGYVAKPFSPETLRAELERVLAGSAPAVAASALSGIDVDGGTFRVFETMFFRPIEALSISGPFPSPACLVSVSFEGDASGTCEVAITASEASGLAKDFLASELEQGWLDQTRVEEVLCELGNMVCGYILSQSKSGGVFRILPPSCSLLHQGFSLDGSWRRFRLDEGELAVRLAFKSGDSPRQSPTSAP